MGDGGEASDNIRLMGAARTFDAALVRAAASGIAVAPRLACLRVARAGWAILALVARDAAVQAAPERAADY